MIKMLMTIAKFTNIIGLILGIVSMKKCIDLCSMIENISSEGGVEIFFYTFISLFILIISIINIISSIYMCEKLSYITTIVAIFGFITFLILFLIYVWGQLGIGGGNETSSNYVGSGSIDGNLSRMQSALGIIGLQPLLIVSSFLVLTSSYILYYLCKHTEEIKNENSQ